MKVEPEDIEQYDYYTLALNKSDRNLVLLSFHSDDQEEEKFHLELTLDGAEILCRDLLALVEMQKAKQTENLQ